MVKKEYLDKTWDLPGGPVVKNPPANARDTGLITHLRRLYTLQGNEAHAPQPQSLHSRTREQQLLRPEWLEPVLLNMRSHQNEKPAHHKEEWPLIAETRGQQRKPSTANNKFLKI